MGTVVDFARGSQEISGVIVVFDSNPDVRTFIEKVEARFFINEEFSCRRKQFPLILAYGMHLNLVMLAILFSFINISTLSAITCHKAQGLSMDIVFADIGKETFVPGMAYVCLSRVRRLSNLYLIDFNPAHIRCCESGYKEYQRLRPTAFPSPLPPLAKCNVLPASVIPLRSGLLTGRQYFDLKLGHLERSWPKLTKRRAIWVPKQKKPRAPRAPKQKKPRAPRAPKQKKPQAARAPTQKMPQASEAPEQKKPQASRAPTQKGPRASRAPEQKKPLTAKVPTQKKPQVSEAPKNNKVVLPAQKPQQQLSSRNPVPANRPSLPSIVRLRNNNGVNCYSNTAVQLFRHLPHFVTALLQAPRTDVGDVLLETMRGRHADTTILRQTVGRGYEVEEMHDASEFFLHIVDALASLEISELFTFDQMSLVTCLQCPGNPLKNAEQTPQLLHQLHPLTDQHQSFHQLLERAQQAESVDARCTLSGGLQVQHARSKRFEFTINDAQKYLLVYLHKFHRVNGQSVKQNSVITDLNADNQIIFGTH